MLVGRPCLSLGVTHSFSPASRTQLHCTSRRCMLLDLTDSWGARILTTVLVLLEGKPLGLVVVEDMLSTQVAVVGH